MKSRYIRILSLFLLLTVLMSTLILPMAAAASVMTIKYTFWGGTNYITYTVYYDDGTTGFARIAGINDHFINNQPAYCLEPQKDSTSGAIYSSFPNNDQNFWYTKLSAQRREAILLAVAYGAPNTLSSTNTFTNYGYIAATQIVIWEFLMGLRSLNPPYQCTNSILFTQMKSTSCSHTAAKDGMIDGYKAIDEALAAHGKIPSFTSKDASSAPTYEMSYDSSTGKYKIVLTDTNNVLSKYSFTKSGFSVSRSGSKLTITAAPSSIEGKTVQFSAAGPLPDVSNLAPIVWGTSSSVSSSDQILMQTGSPSPITVYFNLKAPAPSGTAAIRKSSDGADLEGYCFKIYQYGTNKSFYGKTDSQGKVYVTDSNYTTSGTKNYTFTGLTDGNTILLEALSQMGKDTVWPDSIRITIYNGNTVTYDKSFGENDITKDANGDARLAGLQLTGLRNGGSMSISIHNKSLSVPLEIVKTSTDGKVSGIQFKVEKYEGGWTSVGTYTTDTNGKIQVPGFQIGEKLRITETVPPGYICTSTNPQIITMAAGTNTVSFNNTPIPAALEILKVCEDGKVAGIAFDIEKSVSGDWQVLGTYTTDEDGKINVQDLQQGDRLRVTENVPAGYASENSQQEITLAEGSNTLTFTNTPVPCSLEIIKESPDGNVDGIEFKISRFDEEEGWQPCGHYFTENGGRILLEGLHYADLLEVEELVPEGYNCTGENPQRITLGEGVNTVTFSNDPIAVSLSIIKESTDGAVEGIRFLVEKLVNDSWTELGTYTTDPDGKIRVSELRVGDHLRITEELPEGYHCLTENPQEVTLQKGVNRVTFRNTPDTSLEIIKTSPDGIVEGIEFKVFRWNGRMFIPLSGPFLTDAGGRFSIPQVLEGQTYQIREIVPEGYTCLSENPQEITLEGGLNTVSFENKPEVQLELWKASEDGKVSGIEFTVEQLDGETATPLGVFTTGSKGKIDIPGVQIGKTYRITEHVPAGYTAVQPVQTITIQSGLNSVRFENRILRGSLKILKTDAATQQPLQGAGFRLFDAGGTQIAEGYTDENGELLFEDLAYGAYSYQEFEAPTGYLLDETVYPFSVTEDSVIIEEERVNIPDAGSLAVYKIDEKHEPLEGVTFLLEYSIDNGTSWQPVQPRQENDPMTVGTCDSPGLEDGRLTSGADGWVRYTGLPISGPEGPVLYRLTEIATVNGYNLLAEPAFEGSLPYEGSSDFEITVINTPTYTLPVTGGRGFWGIVIALALTGAFLGGALALYRKRPDL